MPIIGGRFYINPQYGLGLERARAADAESVREHGEPQPSWLDHFLGLVSSRKHKPDLTKQALVVL
jgi:hypothetical protein